MDNKNNYILLGIIILATFFTLAKIMDVAFDKSQTKHTQQTENLMKSNDTTTLSLDQKQEQKSDTQQEEQQEEPELEQQYSEGNAKSIDVVSRMAELNAAQMEERKARTENMNEGLAEITEVINEEKRKVKEEEEAKKREEEKQGLISNFLNKMFKNDPMEADLSDREILAKIIHAEAGGEPYEGKVAVGAVVLNRVRSDKFPNTIKDVVMSPGQFEPVSTGSYQKAKPSKSDYEAADESLSGVDPTGGALYFYAPSLTSVRWHETLTYTTTIGGHKFFK